MPFLTPQTKSCQTYLIKTSNATCTPVRHDSDHRSERVRRSNFVLVRITCIYFRGGNVNSSFRVVGGEGGCKSLDLRVERRPFSRFRSLYALKVYESVDAVGPTALPKLLDADLIDFALRGTQSPDPNVSKPAPFVSMNGNPGVRCS